MAENIYVLNRFSALFITIGFLLMGSCQSGGKQEVAKQESSKYYLDGKVTADESAENVVLLIRFRDGGAESNAVLLEEGSQLMLDGEIITADSARQAGVYYEVQRPLAGFEGKHVLAVTDKSGDLYEQEFDFQPLQIEGMSSVVNKQNWTFSVNGLLKGPVQLLVTDTSFVTSDINEQYEPVNGLVSINSASMQQLASGPITLEVHKEDTIKLANGILLISYVIRREMELRD